MNKLKKVLGLALALLAFAGQSQAQSAPQVVREGIQIGALGALRSALPDVAGKQGLTYDIKDFNDSTAALRALEQGELDIANTTTQHLVRAIIEGIDVVWVAGWGGGYNVLVARKGFNVPPNNPAALKAIVDQRKAGSPVTIAVATGSLQHAKLVSYLRAAKIDPDRDVKIVNIGFPNHPRSLEAGEVDMAMTLAGFGALAIEKSGATLVQQLYDGPFGKQEVGFIVQRKLIQTNPQLVQRIVNSHVEAMKLFIGDMDKQVAYEKKYSRFPDTVIANTERQFLHYDYRTNIPDLKIMAREMQGLGWSRNDVSPQIDHAIDLSFLSKATGLSVDALGRW